MKKSEWKRRYKAVIKEVAGWSEKEVEELYQAGVPLKTMPDWGHDYDYDPEQAAHDEMSYWD